MAEPRDRRSISRVALLLALASAAVVASGMVAAAHGDDGKMQVEATPTGSLQAFVRVTVIFENDSEVAIGAGVNVDATGPDGAIVALTPLVEVGDGRYEATLTFPWPGAWTVRATATDPAATGEVSVTVTETAAATTTTSAPDVEIAESRRARGTPDDEGSSLLVPIVVGVIGVIGVGAAVGVVLLQRRRRQA